MLYPTLAPSDEGAVCASRLRERYTSIANLPNRTYKCHSLQNNCKKRHKMFPNHTFISQKLQFNLLRTFMPPANMSVPKTKRQSTRSAFYHYRKYTLSPLCLFFLQYSLSGFVQVHLSHRINLCINLFHQLQSFLLQYLQTPFILPLPLAFILPSSLSSLPAVW